MDLRKGIGAALLASVALAAPATLAHDPREHELEEQMTRVPVQIQPAAAPLVLPEPEPQPKPEPAKIRFHEMDANGDRKITRKEWRGKGSAFRKLDKNRDGLLAGVEVEVPVKNQQKK
jgi:hypothetical protein